MWMAEISVDLIQMVYYHAASCAISPLAFLFSKKVLATVWVAVKFNKKSEKWQKLYLILLTLVFLYMNTCICGFIKEYNEYV